MKKSIFISVSLLILLTSITFQQKISISEFNLNKILIENNFILKEAEIQKLLDPIYDRNLIFLKNKEIEALLTQNTFIGGFKVQKKYPSTLIIRIFEKKPIAILYSKKNKFYLSENIDLIEYKKLSNYQNLPSIFGNRNEFKILYKNLDKINFPYKIIKKYSLYEINRWDLETISGQIIKLPAKNYIKSLQNYLELNSKNNLKNYKVFDYRIESQLILK